MSTLLKFVMLQTKKTGKEGKKKPNKNGAKKNSHDSTDKEDSNEKDKKSNDPCKLVTPESITFSHPSSHRSCGCRASMDNTVSSISQGAVWGGREQCGGLSWSH